MLPVVCTELLEPRRDVPAFSLSLLVVAQAGVMLALPNRSLPLSKEGSLRAPLPLGLGEARIREEGKVEVRRTRDGGKLGDEPYDPQLWGCFIGRSWISMMELARVGQVRRKIEGRFSPRKRIEERHGRQSGFLRVVAPRKSETGGGDRREERSALTKTDLVRRRGTCGLPQRMHGPLQVEAEAFSDPGSLLSTVGSRQGFI